MSATPWFKFYPGDYLADTQRLTQAQHGAYLLILIDYYATGEAPPDNDAVLASISRAESPADWRGIRQGIAKYFEIREGRWFNARCEKEIGERAEAHEKLSESSKKANKIRWERSRRDSGRDSRGESEGESRNDPIPEVRSQKSEKTKNIALSAPLNEPPAASRPIQSQEPAPTPTGIVAPRKANGSSHPKPEKQPAKSAASWEAYSSAYQDRYNVAPVRNSQANAMLCKLVEKLGEEEAPLVAAFYVGHNKAWYVEHGHDLGGLVKDADWLRTQWFTGRRVTSGQARQIDRTSGQGDVWREIMAEERAKDVQ